METSFIHPMTVFPSLTMKLLKIMMISLILANWLQLKVFTTTDDDTQMTHDDKRRRRMDGRRISSPCEPSGRLGLAEKQKPPYLNKIFRRSNPRFLSKFCQCFPCYYIHGDFLILQMKYSMRILYYKCHHFWGHYNRH